MSSNLTVVILAAGMGRRMKSAMPKALHQLAGIPMIKHVINTAEKLNPRKILIAVNPNTPELIKEVFPYQTFAQNNALGTAHAVLSGKKYLIDNDNILILYADSPLLTIDSLKYLLYTCKRGSHDISVLGFYPKNTDGYGKLIVDSKTNSLLSIQESDEYSNISFCNSGAMYFNTHNIFPLLESIKKNNIQKEYYLSDIIAIASTQGYSCIAVTIDDNEQAIGINSQSNLALAEYIIQKRLRYKALAEGIKLVNPESVFLSMDTQFGHDVIIEPNVFFGTGVTIGDHVTIKAFSYLEGCNISDKTNIGPYARIRPQTNIGSNVDIGNFVEIKNTVINNGTRINHLSYIGDANIGRDVNIGAGTITCNYDGYQKHHTNIANESFIGSNSALIAPVNIGERAIIAAGTVVTKNVHSDSLFITRTKPIQKSGWAARFRNKKITK